MESRKVLGVGLFTSFLCLALAAAMTGLLSSGASAALVLDIRAGATNTVAVTSPNQVVTMDLWTVVTGADGNPANDAISKFYASFRSTNGGLLAGDLAATFTPTNPLNNNPFPGNPRDLDGDGDLDIGSTVASTATYWLLAKAATGQTVPSPINYGTLTFTGKGLWSDTDPHGIVEVWAVGRGSSTTNLWTQDGVNKTGIPATGSNVVLYRPATADAGPPLIVNPGDTVTLDGSTSVGTISLWQWDLNGDGVWDLTGEKPTVTYDYLTGTLGLAGGLHEVTLRTSSPHTDSQSTTLLTIVPEPATLVLLAAGAVVTLVMRRRRR